jgi:phospholipid transport system transporter-binding protein
MSAPPADFALPARLTLGEARTVHEQLQAAVQRAAGRFAVQADGMVDCDSSALAVLMEARRAAQARSLPFELQAPPPKLAQLARLYGVAELLGLAAAA